MAMLNKSFRTPLAVLAAAGAFAPTSHAQTPSATTSVVAFVNANVIPMDKERVLRDQTVIVANGRITNVGSSATVKIPGGALRIDVVVEHIGGETFERSVYALTRLGILVSIGSHDTHWGRVDLRHLYSKNLRLVGTNLGSITELRTLLDYVVAGRLHPVIDRAFPLKDAAAAVQHVLDRRNKGKVLLVP